MSYTNKKYDVNISKENSPDKFRSACSIIESAFPDFIKEDLLIDVDGTTIQAYSHNGKEIIIYDDYDIGAVFAESDFPLEGMFSELMYADRDAHQPVLMKA
ncbi:MAG: hypothetical protein K6E70_01130 [Butyrivibrio sp.]|nr:hypothetical protein [Butyrivibrio sp.]